MRTIICVGTPTVAGAIAALLLRDEGWVVSAAEHMPVDRTPAWPEKYAIDIEGVFDKHWRSSHYTELRAKAVNRNPDHVCADIVLNVRRASMISLMWRTCVVVIKCVNVW